MKFNPEQASQFAVMHDWLSAYINGWAVFFTLLIFVGIFAFAIKYRRRSPDEVPRPILGSHKLELLWTVTPFLISLSMFAWAAAMYFEYASPPADAMEVFVTGRQWMFYTQHPEGPREINELHVPVGRAVKLTMSSEDVIHSFYIPAFRIKRDVIPGRYTTQWFTATKPGRYHLFCAEYCGTQHSAMIGWVYVMEPSAYETWLMGGGAESMSAQGEKLFSQLGCASCHSGGAQGRCPILTNVYNNSIELQGGTRVLADDTYLRESILNPGAKIVAGYQNIMPSFQGQISEQNLIQLITYIKSLSTRTAPAAPASGTRDNTTKFRGLTPTQ
jgi:cytochrome c oxidase subunit 2